MREYTRIENIRGQQPVRQKIARVRLQVIVLVTVVLSTSVVRAQKFLGIAGGGVGAADNSNAEFSPVYQAIGGAEVVIAQRIGASGLAGVAGGGGDAWIPLSLNGSYYIPKESTERFVPYASGGITWLKWLTEQGHERAYNLGAGIAITGTHSGARFEFRDVIRPGIDVMAGGRSIQVTRTRHWWSFNFVATFR